MIVDVHTHVFPPEVVAEREALARVEPVFGALYGDAKAGLATAGDLLASMDRAGIDVSVALGFAWADVSLCRRHNDYLLRAAAESGGRILAFPGLPLASGREAVLEEARRCAAGGARGFGELRPENLDFEIGGDPGDELAGIAVELDAVLLFHVSEPVGHDYAGKDGLDLGRFYRFVVRHPDVIAVGAHWSGGLPFFASIPEVFATLERTYVDTAASGLLYADGVYRLVAGLTGVDRVLFGSDYPLLSQARSRARVENALPVDEARRILGENACRLLKLE